MINVWNMSAITYADCMCGLWNMWNSEILVSMTDLSPSLSDLWCPSGWRCSSGRIVCGMQRSKRELGLSHLLQCESFRMRNKHNMVYVDGCNYIADYRNIVLVMWNKIAQLQLNCARAVNGCSIGHAEQVRIPSQIEEIQRDNAHFELVVEM